MVLFICEKEMDEYKINILGERIGMGDSMMMKDIHCWCTRQKIGYRTKVQVSKRISNISQHMESVLVLSLLGVSIKR